MTRQPRPVTKTRAVYEIRPQHGKTQTVEAQTAAELADHLSRLLNLPPYDSRAAGHVLHVTRATITAPTWSARRLGTLHFQPDQPERSDDLVQRPAARPALQPAGQPLSGDGNDQAHDSQNTTD